MVHRSAMQTLFFLLIFFFVLEKSWEKPSGGNKRGTEKGIAPCTGRQCRDTEQNAKGHSKNDEDDAPKNGKESVKCERKVCKGPRTCQSMVKQIGASKCKLGFCNNGRCSALQPKHKNEHSRSNNGDTKSQDSKKQNRFTHVSRRYTWLRGGRPSETRPRVMAKCIVKKCTRPSQCKKLNPRQKRYNELNNLAAGCYRCVRQAPGVRRCGPWKKSLEVWRARIVVERNPAGYNGTILKIPRGPGISQYFGENSYIGYLAFREATIDLKNNTRVHVIHLDMLKTNPWYRRRGVAFGLTEEFRLNYLRNSPATALFISVAGGSRNTNAVNLYEKYGFHWYNKKNGKMIRYVDDTEKQAENLDDVLPQDIEGEDDPNIPGTSGGNTGK